MRAYVIRRVLLLIPTFFLLTILVFLSVRFIPGDAVDILLFRKAESAGGGTGIDRAELERRLRLDVPVPVQYARWMGAILLRADLGTPLLRPEPVGELITGRLPTTIELGLVALIVGVLIGVPIAYLGRAFSTGEEPALSLRDTEDDAALTCSSQPSVGQARGNDSHPTCSEASGYLPPPVLIVATIELRQGLRRQGHASFHELDVPCRCDRFIVATIAVSGSGWANRNPRASAIGSSGAAGTGPACCIAWTRST